MPLPPGTLGQALDQLPQLLLNLGRLQQERREEQLRREIQQASQDFQMEMLERRMAVEKELTEFKAGIEVPKDPPEVAILGRRIEKDLDILRDPNTALTLGAEEVNAIKSRVKSNIAERERLSGREYYADPSLLELAQPPTPPPLPAPTAKEKRLKGREIREEIPPRIGETEAIYRRRLEEPGITAPIARGLGIEPTEEVPAVEEVPAEFPDPSGFPEGQPATFNGEPWIILNGQWRKVK